MELFLGQLQLYMYAVIVPHHELFAGKLRVTLGAGYALFSMKHHMPLESTFIHKQLVTLSTRKICFLGIMLQNHVSFI